MTLAKILATSGSLLALSCSGALAATADEIVDALIGELNSGGEATVTYDGPTESGGAIVITNLNSRATAGGETFTAATVTLTDADLVDGELTAASIVADDIVATSDEGEITAETIEVTNLTLDTDAPDSAEGNARFDSGTISGITFNDGGATIVTIAEASLSNSDFVGMIPRSAAIEVNEVFVDLAADPANADAVAQLQALGYERLVFDVAFAAGWDEASSELSIDALEIDLEEMGVLSLDMVIGGLTEELIDELNATEGNAPPEAISQLTLESASLTFTDASLTTRLLDMQGASQGISGAEFAQQLTTMLPLVLGQLQNPAFQTEVANAVGRFLTAPGALSIMINPSQAVDFMTIAGVASSAPQTLPTLLGVTVRANDEAGSGAGGK